MKGRYECWLDGQGLTAIDESIILLDVSESEPKFACATESCAAREGLRLLRRTRQSLSVRITLEVHEYDTARRSRIIDQVCAWAAGRVLTVSYRENQRLRVTCTSLPSVSSALRWTDRLTVVLTAFALPYWEALRPTAVSLSEGRCGTAHLRPMGTAESCFLSGEATCMEGQLDSLFISTNGRFFQLNDLGLAQGESLSFGYDEQMLLTIRKGETSLLSCRTPDSADDLILRQRQDNAITLEASSPVSVRFSGRGLYL